MTFSEDRRKTLKIAGGAAAAAIVPSSSWADNSGLPSGTMKILVGYPPGGGTDVMARIISRKTGNTRSW